MNANTRKDWLTTGREPLDRILGGGVQRGSLTVIAGPPGTGKTVLAQQIVFANADPDLHALYLTTFSEPLPKVTHYLERFRFYDPDRMFQSVFYRDLGQRMEEAGVAELPRLVTELVEESRADLVVIDSFRALHDLGGATDEQIRFAIFRLARNVAAMSVTVLLLGEYSGAQLESFPEFAVADAVIELRNEAHGVRDERTLRVLKMRGASHLPGEHTFNISSAGFNVFPRLVRADDVAESLRSPERLASGVPGLDSLVGGGLWRGSSTLVYGPSGAGKTMLGLNFLAAGARAGEAGLLVTLHESLRQISDILDGFGDGTRELLGTQLLVEHFSPLEADLVEIVERIKAVVAERNLRRLVLDSLRDLRETAIAPARLRAMVYNVAQFCSSHGIALLLNSEAPIDEHVSRDDDGLASMVDNVLRLSYVQDGPRQQVITALKTRRSAHEWSTHAAWIDQCGYHVGPALA